MAVSWGDGVQAASAAANDSKMRTIAPLHGPDIASDTPVGAFSHCAADRFASNRFTAKTPESHDSGFDVLSTT
jgi:hypothetical protein